MDNNSAVTLAVVGVLATCVGGLLFVIKFMFNRLLPMIEKSNALTETNTRVTKDADQYLRERNGRDAEIHGRLIKELKDLPNKITQDIKEQKIEHQSIDQQVVKAIELKSET